MIFVFLVVLIMALIIANILISAAKPNRNREKGFANPQLEYAETPEVMDRVTNLHESNSLIQGSLQATNRKLELLNQRITTLEKVVMGLVEKKINPDEEDN